MLEAEAFVPEMRRDSGVILSCIPHISRELCWDLGNIYWYYVRPAPISIHCRVQLHGLLFHLYLFRMVCYLLITEA